MKWIFFIVIVVTLLWVATVNGQVSSDKFDGEYTGQETTERRADKPFDHSSCQYPNRTTNPPDGCDNSDPACPETVKFGSGDCEIKAEPPQTESLAVPEIEPEPPIIFQGK